MHVGAIRLLKTLPHPCGYFAARTARNLVIDPLARDLPEVFPLALERGFRRAGGHIYRPACIGCQACVAARIPLADFRPNRAQRRCIARNADVLTTLETPQENAQVYALYHRYLRARHRGGGMDEGSRDDFERFLTAPWSPTRFLMLHLDGQLVGVAVTDVTALGWSAVYTFFAPELASRGLGTLAILRQIEHARSAGAAHLYLGYWIEEHPKMRYKNRFAPLELLRGTRWERAAPAR